LRRPAVHGHAFKGANHEGLRVVFHLARHNFGRDVVFEQAVIIVHREPIALIVIADDLGADGGGEILHRVRAQIEVSVLSGTRRLVLMLSGTGREGIHVIDVRRRTLDAPAGERPMDG